MRAELVVAFFFASSCVTVAASTEGVLAADRAFAAEAQVRGLQAAFTHFAAQDAWVLRAKGPVRGRGEVEKAFAGTEQVELTWQPVGAEVSAAGDLGFTWGTWQRRLKNDGSNRVRTGRYLTTWRKTPEGYRWVADLGDEDPPAPAP